MAGSNRFGAHRPVPLEADFEAFVQDLGEGLFGLDLLVQGLDCVACVWLIESLLARNPAVVAARVNLSTRRLAIRWRGAAADANGHAALIAALGFVPAPYQGSAAVAQDDRDATELLRCLGVAGFAAANVMLLSVAIWSGHDGSMGGATRTMFHWLSAAIALPAVAYAGRPFFRSAFKALRAGRTNMDVPISIGVTLACIVSLHEAWIGAQHAFFDSAITLLFFLLIGRYLDRRARGRARQAVQALLALSQGSAQVVAADGRIEARRLDRLAVGDVMLVAAGERLGADGTIRHGESALDASLISGESLPQAVKAGDKVVAGMVNLGAPLRVEVTAAGERTMLAEIVRLVEAAEQGRSRFVAIADRVARAYAPVVHVTALLTFLGWTVLGGLAWDRALVTATAVLIITCPCALALAVPVVQVVASTRLMKSGVLLLSPTALERFADVDHVVPRQDRHAEPGPAGGWWRGRLPTRCRPRPASPPTRVIPWPRRWSVPRRTRLRPRESSNIPGGALPWGATRLGSARFCGVVATQDDGLSELWLASPGRAPVRFAFADRLRPDAHAAIDGLRRQGLTVELLSGDRPSAVAPAAQTVGVSIWRAAATPSDKARRLRELAAGGARVLMVGDGLNDAPALATAHASMSPSSATEATQNAADAVFQGDGLMPVVETLAIARRTRRLVRQNLVLALAYNFAAVPLAVLGNVTPLIAAVSMSSSSLFVIVNALRLGMRPRRM